MAEYTFNEDEILDRAKRCYKIVCDAESTQRSREREDLLFQLPENQWSDAAKLERAGGSAGGVQYPARPMLSISLLKQPMQLVYNQFVKARLGVNLHPTGEDADKELVEIKQGLYRRIERDGGAQEARSWAFMRAIIAGRGWYRINTQYDEDADPSGPGAWDQEIVYERILHQESVYMDPSAQKADFRDAKWAFVEAWMSKADFRAKYPDSRAAKATGSAEWEGMENQAPGWVKSAADDKDQQGVLVCEYWWVDEVSEEIKSADGRSRERTQRIVYVAKMNGVEILGKPQKWNGRYIPLVPVIGEELIPVDGERLYQGMVRPARDGQQFANYAITNAAERMAAEPKIPWIIAEGQDEGYTDEWQMSNRRNLPVLHYKPTDVQGNSVPPPSRTPVDASGTSLAMQAFELAKTLVQASTSVFEPALGELPARRDGQSGRAILALQQQSDAGTSGFIQNLVNVSMRHECRIVLDLMPTIYNTKGRIMAIVTGEDETKSVMVGVPFVIDPRTGGPVRAQPGAQGAKTIDLSKGKYAISPDIGKSNQTRMEAGQQFWTGIVEARPELMDIAGDLFFKFRDEPGSKEMSERLKKMIQAAHPNLFDETQGSPEQLQAQVAALQQQLQVVTQQLQQAGLIIQTKQVEQQAKVQIESEKAAIDLKIAEMNNATKIAVARITAAKEAMNQQAEAAEERLATGLKIEADMEMQKREMAHEHAMAAAGGQTMTMSRGQGQDNAQEEGTETTDNASEERSEETLPPQPAGGE